MFEDFDHLLRLALSGEAGRKQAITTGRTIGVEADISRDSGMRVASREDRADAGCRGVLVQRVPDRHGRRLVAAAHAGGADDARAISEPDLQIRQKLRRAGELAAEAVAHTHRHWQRRFLVVHDDVEMGVERGNLVDFDQRQPHLLGKGGQMARMQAAEVVLQQMEMLDQKVATAVAIAE
jgi:hypothetical protein